MAEFQDFQNDTGRLGCSRYERRLGIRFPIELDVACRVVGKSGSRITGRTIDVSSAGILIRTESPLSLGRIVEVALSWPCLLDERIPLQLIVHGRVVRAGAGQLAVALKRFEFRTAKAARGES